VTKLMLAFLLALTLPSFAQVEMQRSYMYALPHFYFDALNFRADSNKSRMDFYFQIPYSELEFVKYGNEYKGSYEISLQLTDDDGNAVVEQIWDERPTCQSFDETNSRKILSSVERQFTVPPGRYTLQVAVTDSETTRTYQMKRPFAARDYLDSPESMSDIMLLKGSSTSAGKTTIIPNVDGNVISQSDSFSVFYEIYFPRTIDSAFVTTKVLDSKKQSVYLHSEWMLARNNVARIVAEIPKHSIPMGVYRLDVSLHRSAVKDAPAIAEASRFFSLHYPDLPLTILNLDEAADEMLYVANGSTIDSIKDARNPVTKEKLFLDFWQKYKTNPSSKSNPIMDEYFNRVAYANEHFTHYFKGWRSDMGMIYILFGPPNSVDRHPFEVDSKPYEVWEYYQTDRQFVFVDESGFGDYRLITPLSDVYSPPYGPDYIGR
jgi:GWxTD domain-containing protein